MLVWTEGETDKNEVIEYVIDTCKVDRQNAVMIGDRRHDIIGASKSGIHSIGVLVRIRKPGRA